MSALRRIEQRIAAPRSHGPITRLISPEAWGERLKPFIFLDFFNAEIEPGFGFPMHPHSGIATLTWQPGCDVQYKDTTGQNGILKAGGLEWMNAGGGAWHQATLLGRGKATGFQLWVPMPPEVEDGPSLGQYVPPHEVASYQLPDGEVKVLLGALPLLEGEGAAHSPIQSHQDMNYLVVTLAAGASWRYEPPAGHDVAWAFVFEGQAMVQAEPSQRELLVFEEAAGAIEMRAGQETTRIILGSAKRHAHPLVLGTSSVHTSPEALRRGLARIREVRAQTVGI